MSSFTEYTMVGSTSRTPLPLTSQRDPTSSDVLGSGGEPMMVGRVWVNTVTKAIWIYAGTGVWEKITSGSGGAVVSVAGTANQVTATTLNGAVTLSTPSTFIAPGSIAATTTVTATLGAITATNGNLVLGTAGNKIISSSVASTTTAGANSFGTVTLVNGTATISTTAVTASSIIILTRQSIGATGANPIGLLTVGTIVAGVSFVINAATTATANTNVTTDVSVVGWMIIN